MEANPRRLLPSLLVAAWVLQFSSIFASAYVIPVVNPGDLMIRSTARLALIFWAIAVALMLLRKPDARLAWTIACFTYLVHVGVAFEYEHHWSHAAAFDHVKKSSGVGEGILVSYFFTLLWTIDTIWWLSARSSYEGRPRWLTISVHGFMVFIVFNSTVIFEKGPIRWIGAGVLIALGLLTSRVLFSRVVPPSTK